MELKTKRLRIVPLNTEQMELLFEGQDKLDAALGLNPGAAVRDEHLQTAFLEMLKQCREHPKEYLWYTNWQIILKDENKSIGSIGFRGPANAKGEVEVGYGIDESYRNQGYMSEALKALCDWAIGKGVYYIRAETESDNGPSKKVLEKCGFKPTGENGENFLYEMERPKTSFTSIFICIGMSIGLSVGLSLNNMAIGISVGLVLGVAVGAAIDAADAKKRKRD